MIDVAAQASPNLMTRIRSDFASMHFAGILQVRNMHVTW